jgi:hypothetical protein
MALTQFMGASRRNQHAVVRHPRRCDLLRGHGSVDHGRVLMRGELNLEGASDRSPITATTAPKIDHLQKLPGAS